MSARARCGFPLALLDVALLAGAYAVALLLRFDGSVPAHFWRDFQVFIPISLGVSLASNCLWGLYGPVWRHASVHEAKRLLLAGCTDVTALLAWELHVRNVPLSVVVVGAGVGTALMGLVRFQYRLFSLRRSLASPGAGVVVIGSGRTGAALVRDMLANPEAGLRPVAVLDVDGRQVGRTILGTPILGGLDDLRRVVCTTSAQQAVLATSSNDSGLVKRAAAAAEEAGIALKVVPGLASRVRSDVSVRDIRDLRIDDLIGREEVTTDTDAVREMVAGRTVLITGAGGSIGSAIARRVADLGPAKLIALDHDESHLYDLTSSMGYPVVPVLADIRHRDRIQQIFIRYRPDIVFHAAAHKHVPLLEEHPCEAVMTNVLGTGNVLDASAAAGVERFIFISTDKAVEPASVMGATKRLGEQLTLAATDVPFRGVVRFGNVIGSRGSVVPTFLQQIAGGGPVTVTHPGMTRYFMSIPEAMKLVLQAASMAGDGDVFVLDMGEPVRIVDLAERMIRLSGQRPHSDVAIEVTGVRPGEKLVERLTGEGERPEPTSHPAIRRIPQVPLPTSVLDSGLLELDRLAAELSAPGVRRTLFDLAASTVAASALPPGGPEGGARRTGGGVGAAASQRAERN